MLAFVSSAYLTDTYDFKTFLTECDSVIDTYELLFIL